MNIFDLWTQKRACMKPCIEIRLYKCKSGSYVWMWQRHCETTKLELVIEENLLPSLFEKEMEKNIGKSIIKISPNSCVPYGIFVHQNSLLISNLQLMRSLKILTHQAGSLFCGPDHVLNVIILRSTSSLLTFPRYGLGINPTDLGNPWRLTLLTSLNMQPFAVIYSFNVLLSFFIREYLRFRYPSRFCLFIWSAKAALFKSFHFLQLKAVLDVATKVKHLILLSGTPSLSRLLNHLTFYSFIWTASNRFSVNFVLAHTGIIMNANIGLHILLGDNRPYDIFHQVNILW